MKRYESEIKAYTGILQSVKSQKFIHLLPQIKKEFIRKMQNNMLTFFILLHLFMKHVPLSIVAEAYRKSPSQPALFCGINM
jgi:hypothetical protein